MYLGLVKTSEVKHAYYLIFHCIYIGIVLTNIKVLHLFLLTNDPIVPVGGSSRLN